MTKTILSPPAQRSNEPSQTNRLTITLFTLMGRRPDVAYIAKSHARQRQRSATRHDQSIGRLVRRPLMLGLVVGFAKGATSCFRDRPVEQIHQPLQLLPRLFVQFPRNGFASPVGGEEASFLKHMFFHG